MVKSPSKKIRPAEWAGRNYAARQARRKNAAAKGPVPDEADLVQ